MDKSTISAPARFLKRLQLRSALSDEECRAILDLERYPVVEETARTLVHPGDAIDHAVLVADGVLARFDLMRNGARQITALFIAGDMCDLQSVASPVVGWGIVALGPVRTVSVPHVELRRIAVRHPNLGTAFWRDTIVDASLLAKAVANIGRKEARPRIAHLLCELGLRMELAGAGNRDDYPLPLTQENIGDAVGLTPVHVNRVVRMLRTEELVTLPNRRVSIGDWDQLASIAEFSPTYLMIDQARLEPLMAAA